MARLRFNFYERYRVLGMTFEIGRIGWYQEFNLSKRITRICHRLFYKKMHRVN